MKEFWFCDITFEALFNRSPSVMLALWISKADQIQQLIAS